MTGDEKCAAGSSKLCANLRQGNGLANNNTLMPLCRWLTYFTQYNSGCFLMSNLCTAAVGMKTSNIRWEVLAVLLSTEIL